MAQMFIIGDQRVVAKLKGADEVIREEMMRAAVEAEGWVLSLAQEFVPVRTGRLRAGLYSNIDWRGTNALNFQIRIGVGVQGVDYGVYVEKGTGIYGERHRPYPVRYGGYIEGEGTFLHRGVPSQPFIAPAFEMARPRTDDLWGDVGHRIARRLS